MIKFPEIFCDVRMESEFLAMTHGTRLYAFTIDYAKWHSVLFNCHLPRQADFCRPRLDPLALFRQAPTTCAFIQCLAHKKYRKFAWNKLDSSSKCCERFQPPFAVHSIPSAGLCWRGCDSSGRSRRGSHFPSARHRRRRLTRPRRRHLFCSSSTIGLLI